MNTAAQPSFGNALMLHLCWFSVAARIWAIMDIRILGDKIIRWRSMHFRDRRNPCTLLFSNLRICLHFHTSTCPHASQAELMEMAMGYQKITMMIGLIIFVDNQAAHDRPTYVC